MRKIYISFILLLICQNTLAQDYYDEKYEAQMYSKFNKWVNDTLPTITDQYSVTYNDTLKLFTQLEIKTVTNAEVKNGKITSVSSTSQSVIGRLEYVLSEIEEFHTIFPKDYKVHMEETVQYRPTYAEQLAYDFNSPDYQLILSTDNILAVYDFYRYIKHAYVYDKRTKQGKFVSNEELKNIYK
jgi:hypothetical protein